MNVVTVTVDNGRLVEGDDGKKEMEFTVKLDGTPVEDVKVRVTGLATTSLHIGAKTGNGQDPQLPQTFGLATETGKGQDFVPLTQTIVFDAHGRKHRRQEGKNDLEQTVRIEVMGDRLAEDDEIFYLQLDNLQTKDTRVRLAGGGEKVTATGVIVDNDEAPVLAPLEDVTIMAGEEVDITASATDTDGDTITYTWTRKAGETTPALPQGTELNQARLTFTPSEGGTYTMTVTAKRRPRQHRHRRRDRHGQRTRQDPHPVGRLHHRHRGGFRQATGHRHRQFERSGAGHRAARLLHRFHQYGNADHQPCACRLHQSHHTG